MSMLKGGGNMSMLLKLSASILFVSLVVATSPAWAVWVTNGVPICLHPAPQQQTETASDGSAGAIIVWTDYSEGYPEGDIYAQRVDASGTPRWTANGVPIGVTTGSQTVPQLISDGAGGAIIVWEDSRRGSGTDIYAQRVNASGEVQWAANGVGICVGFYQYQPKIVPDGAGGAIIVWRGSQGSPPSVHAQRVNASGVAQWTPNGVVIDSFGGAGFPEVASDGAGGAIIAWPAAPEYDTNMYAQRISSAGDVLWPREYAPGIPICTAAYSQWLGQIASDGTGGAVVTWEDYRNDPYEGDADVFAQRVNASGVVQWVTDGVPLTATVGPQNYPRIIGDGAGGAIVTYEDAYTVSGRAVSVQRVGASGTPLWGASGVQLASTGMYPRIISDNAGGAIVAWVGASLYGQRLNASGAIQWTTGGVVLCSASGYVEYVAIASDAASGAIVAWSDARSGNSDIYAQLVDAQGRSGFMEPVITSVQDVPDDQGGKVRLFIERAGLDASTRDPQVATYNVWQRVDDLSALSLAEPAGDVWGLPVKKLNGRCFVSSGDIAAAGALPAGALVFPGGTWELVGNFAACQNDEYIYRATTVADSSASGTAFSVYIVSAHTTAPSIWFASAPDSGYSVDNIPPGPPVGLAAAQSYAPPGLTLSWDANPENDLSYYAVHRGTSEGFVPGPGNLVATSLGPEWFDGSWRWSDGFYYKVAAVDVHGNRSGFALVRPDDVTGTDAPKAPEATYLSQNFPNPFNPTTKIAFGLREPAPVSLRIYDAAGRLVRVLVEGARPTGNYSELWDGRDLHGSAAASGMYFYRLDAGAFSETRKMVLLK